ncbi:MAG: LLM class flavin-dependent oxidoreductase [Gaiella sp.]
MLDCFSYLSYLAGRTSRVRLGTHVYLLGLRHPFVSARAVLTLDQVSGGRAEIGTGAGWLKTEWTEAGFDPKTRGRRTDEALSVCKRLWTEEVVERAEELFQLICGGSVESRDDIKRREDTGITRPIVAPWRRSLESLDGLRRFADRILQEPLKRRLEQ